MRGDEATRSIIAELAREHHIGSTRMEPSSAEWSRAQPNEAELSWISVQATNRPIEAATVHPRRSIFRSQQLGLQHVIFLLFILQYYMGLQL